MFRSNCRKERYNSNQASTEISSIKTAQNARVLPLRKNNREANTIASKTTDSGVSHLSVEIKNNIEKIREQCRNVV